MTDNDGNGNTKKSKTKLKETMMPIRVKMK